MQKRIVVLFIILLLSLGCLCLPEGESQELPTQVPNQTPTTIPTGVGALPTLPNFPNTIELFGGGGAGGPPGTACPNEYASTDPHPCLYADFHSIPSAIGGTTYPTGMAELAPNVYFGLGSDPNKGYITFPRNAELCLGGIPKDQPISVNLISPDQRVTLSATIQVAADPSCPSATGNFDVNWADESTFTTLDDWADNWAFPNNGNIYAVLGVWWAGGLESGIWKVKAAWPGNTLFGVFYAETRALPEISFGIPGFDTKLLPRIDIPLSPDYGGGCVPAPVMQSYSAVIEAFPPDTPVYVLLYKQDVNYPKSASELVYKTVTYSDLHGNGRIDLPINFDSGTYVLLGITNPSTNPVVTANGEFNFEPNATDCMIVR